MRVIFFHIIFGILSSTLLLGQNNSSSWFIQGGLADWEFFLQDRQSFDLRTSLSIGKKLGNRYLIGGETQNQVVGSWPVKNGRDNWSFSWFPSWVGGIGRVYVRKINRTEKRLNLYGDLGFGGMMWSSTRKDPNSGIFERVNFTDFTWSARLGTTMWLSPAVSMDLKATYFPYSFREGSSRNHIRPHELFLAFSLSYWFIK